MIVCLDADHWNGLGIAWFFWVSYFQDFSLFKKNSSATKTIGNGNYQIFHGCDYTILGACSGFLIISFNRYTPPLAPFDCLLYLGRYQQPLKTSKNSYMPWKSQDFYVARWLLLNSSNASKVSAIPFIYIYTVYLVHSGLCLFSPIVCFNRICMK